MDRLESSQSVRRSRLIHHLRLYGDRQIDGYRAATYARNANRGRFDQAGSRARLSLNVVKSCVDSAVSKHVKNRPRPTYLTTAGDFSLQQKAKARSQWLEGMFVQRRAYELRQRAIKNAAIFGDGFLKVVQRHGVIRYENVFPGDIWVDEVEAIHGDPRSLYQVALYDRAVLKELMPGHAKAIDDAPQADARYFGRDPLSDQVVVWEAWRLPSGPDAKDGRHAVVIDGATLDSGPYTSQRFPFAHWRWSEDPLGWHGTGLAEELSGIQFEINQLLRTIQENIYRGGGLKVLLERGANIISEHIHNGFGAIIEYNGTKPDWMVHDLVSNQVMQHLQYLVTSAYQITGISQRGAQSQKPGGLSSGRALLVYSNIESERFMAFGRSDEAAMVDLGELSIEAATQMAERGEDVVVQYPGKRWLQKISAKDIVGMDDDFQLQVTPTSLLPSTAPGRLAMVQELMASGLLGPDKAKKLLDFPDIDAEMELELSPMDLIDQRIEQILEEGKRLPAHSYMNLDMALDRAQRAFQVAEMRGVPDDRRTMLGDFIEDVKELQMQAQKGAEAVANAGQPQAAPPPQGAPMAPPGAEMPMPAPGGQLAA